MHEVAIAQSIVDLVKDQAVALGFKRVHAVRVSIGVLASVEPEALRFGFDAVTAGTVAEGARLVIDRPPGRAFCMGCEHDIEISARGVPCPGCGGFRWLVTAGEELAVRDLEVD
jgi:hydrogenase nickel incorporation protein HypA/HybF